MYRHVEIGRLFKRKLPQKKFAAKNFTFKPSLSGAIQPVCTGSRKSEAKFREPVDKLKFQPALSGV